ncbi:MAG: extensin family protein [Methylobacterium sp.]|uniref:extensin-like domain-containing protein n=1 Tax=Methylobacterium sp. TaxID=409 RepID=UPI0025D6920E|nr:extensin family protein [Methylobacterium sp.]MBX9934511.1 extensin family protein [Methylobacterium sp.]
MRSRRLAGAAASLPSTILILALFCATALAQGAPPSAGTEGPPQPPPRPEELKPVELPAAKPAGLPEKPVELPLSPPTASEMPTPPQRPPELSGEAALALKVQAPDDTGCRRRLSSLGATFEPLPPISLGQCGAEKPLKVSRIGSVAIEPPATLVCGVAEALARWTTEVQVAAERDLGHPLASLSVGSYECRGQNHSADARLSEHALANAIDVMAYGFAGRSAIKVVSAPEGTPEASFQAAARAKACGFFRTVLGPGSDAAHANHLHLDERERQAGHRLCQ